MGATTEPADLSVIIVGSGFAGLCMAIRLQQSGVSDFMVLEREGDVGGVWRDNTYPGIACDIESHLYSYSFAPNPDWSRTFAPQREILAYLRRCADTFGVRPKIRFRCGVVAATFDEEGGRWRVETSDGSTFTARVLVSGSGHALSKPILPDLPGLASFAGPAFHSARWDHTVDLAGKHVAVIGTGASAIQIIPSIAPVVASLLVMQRTPPWVLPRNERPIDERTRARLRRYPFWQKLLRGWLYLRHELMAYGVVRRPAVLRLASRVVRRLIAARVKDPVLRDKVTPRYTLGCKRVLLSDDYYAALGRANVTVCTEAITEVQPGGLGTADGALHPVDVLVFATGFEAAEGSPPFAIRGRGGQGLAEAWRDGIGADLGTAVAGFPNFFLLLGPNVGLGHSSMVYMIESQVAYVLDAVLTLRARDLRSVEVRREVEARYNEALQRRLAGTVWQTGGCTSWYQRRDGRNTTLWPGYTFEFRRRTRRFDAESYQLVGR